ncbi:MAG: CRISPR-associated endonuclease Cas1 [Campylobacteraceae bacterium]|nr:CRISPR-associated endonuclease Cas1 [Campylobacteraceae bacterium]
MFTAQLEHIITSEHLHQAFEAINQNALGLDEISYRSFQESLHVKLDELRDSVLQGIYVPEPLKKIEIDKPNSDETRSISLGSIKDKIIQRALNDALKNHFEETFSDKSYAYRSDKSTINAINRTQEFLNQKLHIVLKTDINNFFENINHDKLLQSLENKISDKRIIKLIALFFQTGGFFKYDFLDHALGVHQGDILSPLLSNIYLDLMDKFLEKKNIAFVRYADDFVLFFKTKEEAFPVKEELENFLKLLDLTLGEDKTSIVHLNEGFTFLGVCFEGKTKTIENERLHKSFSKLHKIAAKKESFLLFIKSLNTYMLTCKNYYLKIIPKNSTQFELFQQNFIEATAQKIYLSKQNDKIKTKKAFKLHLASLPWYLFFAEDEIKDKIELMVNKGVEKYLSTKSYLKTNKAKIEKKKNHYAKQFAKITTLHVKTKGIMLSIAKNKFVLKEYGKVKNAYAIDTITRIILEGKGFSLSSDVISTCALRGIPIDFIDKNALPYASLVSYKASTTQTIHKQALLLQTQTQLDIAKEFIRGKAKNQINYLKYLDKYHALLKEHITQMSKILNSLKIAKDTNAIMGYEGSISALYWDAIKLILEVPFEGRVTFGAKDIVNSSLNYGYAILYGKVQHCLIQSGVSLHISFLHALDDKKPTLVYDMIEEFRTFIVDRTIISMLNKSEPIKLDKEGFLTEVTRKLIATNIYEKLGSYTMWKKESRKVENIIQTQCYQLSDIINQKDETYKAFIGKY